MNHFSKTIAAISTGRSEAGIGVIRISGDNAIEIADRVFTAVSGKKLYNSPGYRAHYGTVHDTQDSWHDNAVALVFRAPKSYTGEDVVELSCHGGTASTELTLSACIEAGAYPAAPGEFTRRAFENGKMTLSQAEAVMSVISAEGRQAAVTAQAVLDGKLKERIDGIIDILRVLASDIAAWCDYPDEEEVPAVTGEKLLSELGQAKDILKLLLEQGKGAIMLENGIETVICGKPNVGKSTLMNLIAGREKSIVTDIAGTTRDIIDERVMIGDCMLHLYDTAGIHDSGSEIENIGVDRARRKIESSALVLFVVDSSAETDDEDDAIYDLIKDKNCIGITNKSDIANDNNNCIDKYNMRWVSVSAKYGTGLDSLKDAIEEATGISKLDPAIGNIINSRQYYCVNRAYENVIQAMEEYQAGMPFDVINVLVCDALDDLYELTGEKVTETIVDEIFSKFCLGK